VQLKLADRPASIGAANATAGGHYARSYHYRWSYHHAWRDYSAAPVAASVITVATAAAVWAAMKARSTATGHRNCQVCLCLFKRCERDGRRGSDAEEADADGRCEGKKFGHLFLLTDYAISFRNVEDGFFVLLKKWGPPSGIDGSPLCPAAGGRRKVSSTLLIRNPPFAFR